MRKGSFEIDGGAAWIWFPRQSIGLLDLLFLRPAWRDRGAYYL